MDRARLGRRLALAAALLLPWAGAQAAKYGCDTEDKRRHVLLMRGSIGPKESEAFSSAFDRCFPSGYAGQVVVDLSSGGGVVTAALRIANGMISYGDRISPVMVRVSPGGYCISACTYLFVAGTMREVRPGGSLEPHGFSGYRGARMVTHAPKAVVDGKVDPEKAEYGLGTLLLARVMGSLALADARFGWLGHWLREFNQRSGQVDDHAPARLMEAYLRMNEAQRRAVDGLESATTVVMTELQRLAALRAFEPLQGGRGTGSLDDGEVQQLQQWMLKEYLSSLNGYLSATRQVPLKHLSAIAAEVEAVQATELQRSRNMVTQQLAPYLARRDQVMDMASFVRLMFSTSIIYTRPLTHEELCDFNLDNTSCR